MLKAYVWLKNIFVLLISFYLFSSSYIFTKLSWTTTWPKLRLLMRVDGTSTLKSFMLKLNGRKRSWSHLWLTIVRTHSCFVFFEPRCWYVRVLFFPPLQILFSSSYIANSTTVMCILAFNPTSTIAFIHTKIVANFSITFSVRSIVIKILQRNMTSLTCYRFWRTCTAWTAGTMALGYHRRIYLSISSFLYLAL